MYLYHYFDKSTGPFKNLSDLPNDKAKAVLKDIRRYHPYSQSAARDDGYIERRAVYEQTARRLFKQLGGRMERYAPHYMTIGHSDWLYGWYEDPAFIRIPIGEFDLDTLSFTYGDMHPTFSPIVTDGKEYRGKLYMYDGILDIISRYGMPQDTPPAEGEIGHPFYVEVQVWSDRTIEKYKDARFWESI